MKSRPGLVLAALAWLSALAPAPARAQALPPELDALLSRAVVAHQTGDLETAAGLYVQFLRAAPGAALVRSNLGAVYAGLGRYEEAIVEYQRALAAVDEPSIRKNLALALQKAGRLEDAVAESERLLAAQPGSRDVLLLLADTRLRLGEDAKVVELLAPVAATAPDDKAVAYLLGTALLDLDRRDEAQSVMNRLFSDDTPEAHVLLGSMHSRRHEYGLALAEFDKARAANPKLPLVNFFSGEALMKERNDWAGAAAAFRAELAIDPNHFESNLLLGSLLREEGRHQEAIAHLTRAARLRPADLAVKFSLGAAYLATGRMDEARALLEEVGARAPGHLGTQVQLAQLYTRLGLKEEAAEARKRAVALQKDADSRAFQGARESVIEAIGRSAGSAPPKP